MRRPTHAGLCTVLLSTVAISVALAAPGGGKGKPGAEEPPPESPAGDACAGDDTTAFPAMAYAERRIVGTSKNSTTYSYDLFLANSDASCSILLYASTEPLGPVAGGFSYRQVGKEGHIVWGASEKAGTIKGRQQTFPVIMSLSFSIEDNKITTPLPLTPSRVFRYDVSQSVAIVSVVLAPDLSAIFYTLEEADGNGSWRDSLHRIDLSGCSSDCPSEELIVWNNRGVAWLSMNPTGTRIYMSGHDRNPDVHAVWFIERQGENWSPVKEVVTTRDGGYETARFGNGGTSAANWNYGIGDREVLAFNREDGTGFWFDIIDVQDCEPSADGSCLANDPASLKRQMLGGSVASFTSFSTQSVQPPTVLVLLGGGVAAEVDPNTGTIIVDQVVKDAYVWDIESAD